MERIIGLAQASGLAYLILLSLMAFGERLLPARAWPAARRGIIGLVLLYPTALLALTIGQIAAPREDGLLAVLQIFAPYLFAPLLLILPFALFRGTHPLRWALLICALVFVVRFMSMPGFSAPQPSAQAAAITAPCGAVLRFSQRPKLENHQPTESEAV